jgi:hypothetical protein
MTVGGLRVLEIGCFESLDERGEGVALGPSASLTCAYIPSLVR